jgi:hypothetical protein
MTNVKNGNKMTLDHHSSKQQLNNAAAYDDSNQYSNLNEDYENDLDDEFENSVNDGEEVVEDEEEEEEEAGEDEDDDDDDEEEKVALLD